MDKRRLVLDAMDGKEVPRAPGSFWFHFSGQEAEGEGCVRAHLEYYRESGIDFVKVMSDGFSYSLSTEPKSASDWRKLKALGPRSSFVRGQVERAKRIVDEIGGEACVFYNVFAPFSLMRQCAGDAAVMGHLREDREAVVGAIRVISEDVAELATALISEAGCTGIYLALQGGELYRFSPEEYRDIVSPSDLAVLSAANARSGYNIAHLCGWAGDRNRLEVWKDYPAKVFNWAIFVEGVDIAAGRALFPGKTLLGGFDNRKVGLLYGGSDETIASFARDLLAKNGKRGYMVGADCTLPADVDRRRVKVAMDVLKAAE